MAKKVYISGKISGLKYIDALYNFQTAEDDLIAKGCEVVNPMKLDHDHDKSWKSFMRVDLKAMLDCDTIYMLEGYKDSPGAMVEFRLACDLKMKILFQQ